MNKEVIAQFLNSVDANGNGDNGNDDNNNSSSGNNYYNRQQDDLVEAYRQAGRYRDLRHFIRNRFKDEDRLEDFNKEVELNGDLMPNEDPFVTKLDPSSGSRHDLRKSSTSGSSSSSTRGKRGGSRSSGSSSPAADTSLNNVKFLGVRPPLTGRVTILLIVMTATSLPLRKPNWTKKSWKHWRRSGTPYTNTQSW